MKITYIFSFLLTLCILSTIYASEKENNKDNEIDKEKINEKIDEKIDEEFITVEGEKRIEREKLDEEFEFLVRSNYK